MGRPVSGGGHGEAKAQQRQQQKQHRQEHRQSDVLQQPCHHQIGITRELIRRQQVGGDGQLLLGAVGKGERKGLLHRVQRLVAVRQRKVFKGDLSGVLVNDRQMAVGVLTGEAFREGAGQIVQHLLLFLVGDAAGRGIRRGIRARRVIRQQSGVGHDAAQIVVGIVNGAAALCFIHRLAHVCAAVQKYVVAGQNTDAKAAQHRHGAEQQRQEKGRQLGPCFIQKSFHVRVPSIL